jgi:hypothetical protein
MVVIFRYEKVKQNEKKTTQEYEKKNSSAKGKNNLKGQD